MTEPAHERKLTHASLPHARGMGMPESMGRHAGPAHPGTLTGAREQLGERGIGQRLAAAPAMAADEEKEGGASVTRALERHVVGDRSERRRFVQVDDALAASLGAHPARMVLAMAHDDAPAAVGNILELEAERLAGPQTTVEHETDEREIASTAQRREDGRDLLVGQRPWHLAYRPYGERAPDRRGARDALEEG